MGNNSSSTTNPQEDYVVEPPQPQPQWPHQQQPQPQWPHQPQPQWPHQQQPQPQWPHQQQPLSPLRQQQSPIVFGQQQPQQPLQPPSFEMPLLYPSYRREDYGKMSEEEIDSLLENYGFMRVPGDLVDKRKYAMETFRWEWDHFSNDQHRA